MTAKTSLRHPTEGHNEQDAVSSGPRYLIFEVAMSVADGGASQMETRWEANVH